MALLSFSRSVEMRKCEIGSPGSTKPVKNERLSHPPTPSRARLG
jgi:hypothetical protein